MKSFIAERGLVAPMDRANVDTDLIIPKQFLKSIRRSGFGPHLFDDLRYLDEGQPGQDCSIRPQNPDFPLNHERYQGASILLARENFGCGSSREHAPQAIQKFGLKAVIAESFAEIFYGNCTTLGIPCVMMDKQSRAALAKLIEADPDAELVIDIEGLKVICANQVFDITMKNSAREALLAATFDPLDTLLASAPRIDDTARRLGYV